MEGAIAMTDRGAESDNDALAPDEVISEVQAVLTELYAAYLAKTGKRKVSDNAFARWLRVSPSNWNYWINGSRIPELKNALLLAPRIEELLGRDERVRFMRMLGYGNFYEVNEPGLQALLQVWDELPREAKEQIHEIINTPRGGRSSHR